MNIVLKELLLLKLKNGEGGVKFTFNLVLQTDLRIKGEFIF